MKIHEIALTTPSISLVQDFYQDLLHLDCQPGPSGSIRLQTGLSYLHFTEQPTATGIYHFAFNIPANQIQGARDFLHRQSIRLITNAEGEEIIPFPNWRAQSVYFLDPAGNIVEFIARQDLHNDRQRAFGPDALLEISEIGIVTNDVWAWRTAALEQYGIGDFDKQPASPGFSALGSDQGLFIVVPVGRQWLMTEIAATRAPLKACFENAEGQQFTVQY